jgi:putative endonuclease
LIATSDDAIVVGMWCVYILRCADDSLYIGETNDIDLRVIRHNDGRASSFTAARRPVFLMRFSLVRSVRL